MQAPSVRLVCFDLGGVILRICRTWAEGCEAAGLAPRDGTDEKWILSPTWDRINRSYQRGEIDVHAFTEQLSALIDGRYSAEEILRVHQAWTRGEYEGVCALVVRVHDAGVATAILSNTNHEHWITFPRYPAFQMLQNRHGSHLLRACKPDEAAYRAIEAHTGCAGDGILFFDDLSENVDGARRVGWRAEQIDPHQPTDVQMVVHLREHGVL